MDKDVKIAQYRNEVQGEVLAHIHYVISISNQIICVKVEKTKKIYYSLLNYSPLPLFQYHTTAQQNFNFCSHMVLKNQLPLCFHLLQLLVSTFHISSSGRSTIYIACRTFLSMCAFFHLTWIINFIFIVKYHMTSFISMTNIN